MILQEYEYIFCCGLHSKLKERVRGKVYATVKDDILMVEIHMKDVKFEVAFSNFAKLISACDFTVDKAVHQITKMYKKYLSNLYFWN